MNARRGQSWSPGRPRRRVTDQGLAGPRPRRRRRDCRLPSGSPVTPQKNPCHPQVISLRPSPSFSSSPGHSSAGTEKYLLATSQGLRPGRSRQATPRSADALLGRNLVGERSNHLVRRFQRRPCRPGSTRPEENGIPAGSRSISSRRAGDPRVRQCLAFGLQSFRRPIPQRISCSSSDKMGTNSPRFAAKVLDQIVPGKEKVGSTTIRSFALPQTQIGWCGTRTAAPRLLAPIRRPSA